MAASCSFWVLGVRSQDIVDIGYTHLNKEGELCPTTHDRITKTPSFAEPPSNALDPASLPQGWHDNSTAVASGSIHGCILVTNIPGPAFAQRPAPLSIILINSRRRSSGASSVSDDP